MNCNIMSRSVLSKVRGIVPFYKEAGISSFTVLRWIKLHIAYENFGDKHWYIPHVESYRNLEPYASGVYTVGIGGPSLYIKYLQFCDCRYSVKIRVGQSTTNDFYKSDIIDTKPFNHVNLEDVKNACSSFTGTYVQAMPHITFREPCSWYQLNTDQNEETGNYEENKDSTESRNFWNGQDQMRYKVRDVFHHRMVTCHSIEITHFDPPDISFEIFCGATFVIRSLVKDLCEKLGTYGSIVKLKRTQEGPFTLDHCIDKTDLYMKYLKPALTANTVFYIDHVRQHLDKLPFYGSRRIKK